MAKYPSCINVSNAYVSMYLKGENHVTQNAGHSNRTDNGSEFAACAIEKSGGGGSLSIQLADGLTDNADGILVVQGKGWHEGAITAARSGVASLISYWEEQGITPPLPSLGTVGVVRNSFANLTISSGTVAAASGAHTPGIGAACQGESCKNIVIDGAWVKAVGGEFCAGIGTGDGYRGTSVTTSTLVDGVTISGGAQVYAKGGACAAGIGTGGEDIGTVDDGSVGVKNLSITGGETVVVAVGDDGTSKMYGNRYYTTAASGTWGMASGVKTPGIGVGYAWQTSSYAGQIDSSTVLTSGSSSEVDSAWYSGKEVFPDVVSEMNEASFKTNGPGQTDDGKAKAWEARLQYGDSANGASFFSRPDTGSLDVSGYTGLGDLSQAALEAGNPVYYMRFYFMPADTLAVDSDKDLVSQTLNADGTSTLVYEMTLVNNGEELATTGWTFEDVPTTDGTVTLSYTGPATITQATDPAASWTDARSGAAWDAAADTSKYYVSKTSTGFSVSALPVGARLVFRAGYKSSGPLVASAENHFTGPEVPDGEQHYSVEVDKVRVSSPDASGTAVPGDSRVRPGDPIYYKVTATNASADKAGDAIALPAGETAAGTVVDQAVRGLTLTKVSAASGSATLDSTANSITWTLGYMAAGATFTMYVSGTVTDEGVSADASEAADTVNKAYAKGDPPSVKVVSTPHAPELAVNKVLVSFDPETGAAVYRIYVANGSDKDYVSAPVSDTLSNAKVTSVTVMGATLSSGPAAGATGSLSMVLSKVPANTAKTAVADSRNPAGWTSAVYVEVSARAVDVEQGVSNWAAPGKRSHTLAKTRVDADGSTSARPASETLAAGQTVWYRVTLTNTSAAAIGPLTVTDAPVSHLRLDSVGTVGSGSAKLADGKVTWTTGSIAAGATVSMWVSGTVLALQASEGSACEVTNAAFDDENSVVVTDVEVGMPFAFVKTDKDGAALAGATFSLFACGDASHTSAADHSERATNDAGCCWKAGDSVQTATSGTDGKVTFTGLGTGQYMLVETAAPDGYELPHGQWMLDVDVAAQTVTPTARGEEGDLPPAFKYDSATKTYSVANYEKWTMPLAGGTGPIALTVCGAALIAAAFAWLLLARRKKREA